MSELKKFSENILSTTNSQINPSEIPNKCNAIATQLEEYDHFALQSFDFDSNQLVQRDADFMVNASNVHTTLLKSLTVGSRKFDFKHFASKLNANWDGKANEVSHLIRNTPTYSFIYGTFDPGSVTIPPKKSRKVATKLQEVNAPLIKPSSSKGAESTDDLKNGEEVAKMHSKISELVEKNNNEAVGFAKAVVDLNSFGQTVENIFYTSFLVKEGLLSVKKERGQIVVKPEQEPSQDDPQDDEPVQNKQCILTLSMEDYKEWVKALQEDE